MNGDLEQLPERVDVIEHKLDARSSRVDALSPTVDRRFDEVTASFVEQGEYTEFAFERLRTEMAKRFDRVDGSMESLEGRLEQHLGRLERKIDQVIDMQSTRR